MDELEIEQLRQTVERTHGGKATLVQSISVSERSEGGPVWDGIVHVFHLEHCPTATRAYAWSESIPDSTKRRLFSALHLGTIDSPAAAVRSIVAEEHRSRKRRS
jgi:hypothetical protein